jgi:hypothetical protein
MISSNIPMLLQADSLRIKQNIRFGNFNFAEAINMKCQIIVTLCVSICFTFGCKRKKSSCLNSSGSPDGDAPFANEILAQQPPASFQLISTGETDPSGAKVAFLSGELPNGLTWKSPIGQV